MQAYTTPLRPDKKLVNLKHGLLKPAFLIFLADKGLDHADSGNIFLDTLIQRVISGENLAEIAAGFLHHHKQKDAQRKNRDQVNAGKFRIDEKSHGHRHNQRGRCPEANP